MRTAPGRIRSWSRNGRKMKSYAAVMEIWLCDNGMESLEESLL